MMLKSLLHCAAHKFEIFRLCSRICQLRSKLRSLTKQNMSIITESQTFGPIEQEGHSYSGYDVS